MNRKRTLTPYCEALRRTMRRHDLKAEDVAAACEVSVDTVYSWRTGRRPLDAAKWAAIEQCLARIIDADDE